MSIRRERISFLPFGRVAGILLVVLGHSYPYDTDLPWKLYRLRDFIYAFHMPLFIFISGYLAAKSTRTPGMYVAARARKLLIPYFALSLAAFVPKMLVQQFLNDSVEFSLGYLIRSELIPRENVWGHFWYIPVIFFFGVFSAYAGKYLRKGKWISWVVLAVSWGLRWLPETTDWFALEDMRKTLFFYVLGYVVSCAEVPEIFKSKLWLLGFPAALLLFGLGIPTGTVTALAMIGFLLHLGTGLDIEKIPALRAIEQNSFTVFLLSWPAQAVVEVVLNRICHMPCAVTMAGMFTAGLAVPLVCVKIVKWLEKYIPLGWLKTALGM